MIKTVRALLKGTGVKNVCIPPAQVLPGTEVARMNEYMMALVTAAYSFLLQHKPNVDAKELEVLYRLLMLQWPETWSELDAALQEAVVATYYQCHGSDECLTWFTTNFADVEMFIATVIANRKTLSPFNKE